MGLATYRHTDTGELIELSEDWLTRFPKDPYERVAADELTKLETQQRQAAADAVGAQPYQQPDTGASAEAAPAPAGNAKSGTGTQDTPTGAPDPRDQSRF